MLGAQYAMKEMAGSENRAYKRDCPPLLRRRLVWSLWASFFSPLHMQAFSGARRCFHFIISKAVPLQTVHDFMLL